MLAQQPTQKNYCSTV